MENEVSSDDEPVINKVHQLNLKKCKNVNQKIEYISKRMNSIDDRIRQFEAKLSDIRTAVVRLESPDLYKRIGALVDEWDSSKNGDMTFRKVYANITADDGQYIDKSALRRVLNEFTEKK